MRLFSFAWLGFAIPALPLISASPFHLPPVLSNVQAAQDSSNLLQRRDARKMCSATNAAHKPRRRSLDELLQAETEDPLTKRTFSRWPTTYAGPQDKFMVENVNNAVQALPNGAADFTVPSTAIFSLLGDTTYSAGIQELVGCTALIVASQQAVYMAHFWEDPSISNLTIPDVPDTFQAHVVDFLNNGDPQHPDVQQSLRAHAPSFNSADDVNRAAWVMWPTFDPADGPAYDYTDKINLLKQTVTEITGIDNIQDYRYVPGGDVDAGTTDGRVLYQYDPQAKVVAPRKGFRVITERKLQAEQYWN